MLWSVLRLIFKTSSVTPDFFYVFNLILSFSTGSQSFKKSVRGKFLGANVLKFVGVSSKHLRVFLESLRQSSAILGHLRKFSENVRERSSGPRNNFGKSSEIFGKWSEIFGKSSKTPSSACLYNKKNITRRLEDMNFIFSWQKQYFTHSLRSFVRYCFATRK